MLQRAGGISQFLRGKSILITGSTGFVGKCLVEKLIRDVPQLDKIYLLIRPKAGEAWEDRAKKYFNSGAFGRIGSNHGQRVEFVQGDITNPDCGLSPDDKENIARNVNIVLHSAAAISFTMPVHKAVARNTEGTKNLLELATEIHNLQAFVSISTAYSSPHDAVIEEKVYPANLEPLQAIELFENLPPEWAQKLHTEITGKSQNTYLYSKQLAENLVQSYHAKLPVCIVRPSVILAANEEPYPGWNETDTSYSVYWKNVFTGVHHTSLIVPNNSFAITPADTLVNTVLAAAWRQATTKSPNLLVYNCVADQHNPLTYKQYINFGVQSLRQDPPAGLDTYPWAQFTRYYSVFIIKQILFRLGPTLVYNLITKGNPDLSSSLKTFRTVSTYNRIFTPAIFFEWRFTSRNMKELNELMFAEERKLFPVDFSSINWETFTKNYAQGLFKFRAPEKNGSKKAKNIMWLRAKHWTQELIVLSPFCIPGIAMSQGILALSH